MFAPPIAKPKSIPVSRTVPDRALLPSTTRRTLVTHGLGPRQSPDHAAALTGNAATPSWSFSNLRIYPSADDNSNTPRKVAPANSETNRKEVALPVQSAIERKRGSGQPLGHEARHRLERTFDADFSTVRVHTDSEAGRLSRALGANAFTTGRDIFFDHGAYEPDNFRGQKLLAHELTHVVQQRGAAPSKLVLGEPGGHYEREADAISTNIAATRGQLTNADSLDASHGSARPAVTPIRVTPVTSSSTSLVQRDPNKDKKKASKPVSAKPATTTPAGAAPVKTWSGDFTAPTFEVGSSGDVYGANIVISFMPNKSVDAESIALVQTAQGFNSSIGTQVDPRDEVPLPGTVKTEKAQEVFKDRLVEDVNDFGRHIDQLPESRTPLTNATVGAGSTELAESAPIPDFMYKGLKIHTQFGFRTDKKGARAAMTADTPSLTLPVSASGSQHFETTALAIDGIQKGTYYGSVMWGWRKEAGKTTTVPIEFEKSKDAAPSSGFFAAATKWNTSKNTEDKRSISLPISGNKVLSATSELMDGPDAKAKPVARLDMGTTVETIEDASHPDWVKVIVTAPHKKGQIGWIKASQLTDPPSNDIPKKKN
jgi:hypothetical protein